MQSPQASLGWHVANILRFFFILGFTLEPSAAAELGMVPIASQTVDQHRTLVLPVRIIPRDAPAHSIRLNASADNLELLPESSLKIDDGIFCTLTIQPVTNAVGSATITITATNEVYAVTQSFLLTVRPAPAPLIAHRVHGATPYQVRTPTGTVIMSNDGGSAAGLQSWTWLNYPEDGLTSIPFIHQVNLEPIFNATRQVFPQNGTFTLTQDDDLNRIGDGFVLDAAFGNGVYVGITGSQIYTSNDGITWTEQTAPLLPERPLHRVAFGNGKFVVAGDEQILYSTNGVDWNVANRPETTQWRIPALAFGGGKFVAIGHGYALMGWPTTWPSLISEDGVNWTYAPENSAIGMGQIRDIIHHGGRFVAAGATVAATSGLIATSEDGSAWEWRFWSAPNFLFGLSEAPGSIVASGEGILLSSRDGGLSWNGLSWGEGLKAARTDYVGGANIVDRFLVSGSTGEMFRSEPVPRLVAHYPLNGNATDRSGNELHGTVHGAKPAIDRFGDALGALRFDGVDDFIDCENQPHFNFTTSFTLSAWVKLNGAQQNRYIIAKYPFSSGETRNSYGLATDEQMRPYAFVSGNGPGFAEVRGSSSVHDGNWHALAMVYDASFGVRLYVDGESVGTVSAPFLGEFNNPAPLTIGSLTSGLNFGGEIDDVRIFADALSDLEIDELHTRGEAPLQITVQPKDAEAHVGTNATFSVGIAGALSPTARFQWFEGGVPVPGATNSTYVTSILDAIGEKTVTVTVQDSSETILLTSMPAILTILPPADLDSDLLAHWSFDQEFTTTVPDGQGQFPGQLSNGTRIPGRIGSGALQLTGTNSFLFVGGIDTSLMLTGTPYTISWWQKWDGPNAKHQNIFAMDDGADYSGGYSSYISGINSLITFVHDDGEQGAWFNIATPIKTWRHYAVTYDGEMLRLYVHGQPAIEGPARKGLIQDGDDPLVIGALRLQSGSITNFFRGALDDFRIYNRALSLSEIKMLGPTPEITILEQPAGYRAAAGTMLALRAAAEAVGISEPVRMQWEVDGTAVPEATNGTFAVTATTGAPKKVRVHFTAGDLEAYSEEASVVAVNPGAAGLLLHLDFESLIDGQLINKAAGETNVQVTGEAPLIPGRVGDKGIAMNSGVLSVPAAGTDLELAGSSYTIAWWMRQTRQASGPVYSMSNNLASPVRSGYSGVLFSGGNQFLTYHGSTPTNGALIDPNFFTPLPRWTNWLHVAVIYNGAQRMIYTNGVLAASRQAVGSIIGSGRDDLYIGGSWFGVLDDFRIYNYALTGDELSALVDVPLPESRMEISIDGSGLLIRWPNDPATQYRLDYSTTLGETAVWQPANSLPQVLGGFVQVRPAFSGERRYFRLRKL